MPIFSDSKNKEAAWSYLSWLMKPENAVFWVSGLGNLPTRTSIRDGRLERAHCQASADAVVPRGSAPSAAPYFGKGAQEVLTLVGQAIEKP